MENFDEEQDFDLSEQTCYKCGVCSSSGVDMWHIEGSSVDGESVCSNCVESVDSETDSYFNHIMQD